MFEVLSGQRIVHLGYMASPDVAWMLIELSKLAHLETWADWLCTESRRFELLDVIRAALAEARLNPNVVIREGRDNWTLTWGRYPDRRGIRFTAWNGLDGLPSASTPDLLVADEAWFPASSADLSKVTTRQLLVVGNPGRKTLHRLGQTASGATDGFWPTIPLEVILAGSQ